MLQVELRHDLGGFRLDMAFRAEAGSVLAVVGPSGAGKTSLLAAIGGAYRPAQGRIVHDGVVFFDAASGAWLPPERRRIGWVYQDARLFPHMPVQANLRYGEKRSRGRRIAEFTDVVEVLELAPLLSRRPAELSGGEKQRVALGRALLSQPDLMLMDEPLAALHMALKAEILGYIERLKSAFHLPIVYVTHQADEARRIADEVLVIDDGRVRAQGPASAILATAGALWTADVEVRRHDENGHPVVDIDGRSVALPALEARPGERLRISISRRTDV